MKRKLLFILGIVIMVAGVGIFLFPIISQAYNAHQQRIMMEDVKKQILESMFETASDKSNETAVGNTDSKKNVNTASKTDPTGSDDVIVGDSVVEGIETTDEQNTEDTQAAGSTILGDLVEEETVEEQTFKSSRLSGQKCVGIITIETINLIYPVVEGVETDNIGVAIGHFPDSAQIGAEGNCAMAGHNGGTYGRYFGDIKNLKKGDEVILTNTKGEEYKYYITESFVVEPTDIYVVDDLGIEGKFLTMVTCTQHGTKRLIVRAECTEEATLIRGLK